MKQNSLIFLILLVLFSFNTKAQSKQTSTDPLKAISKVSGMAHSDRLSWNEGLVYKVQFLTAKKPLAKDDARLKNLSNVYHYQHNGLTKYVWGRTRLPQEAQRLKRELHRNGFKDAFVVYFYNGKRITQQEAKALAKGK